VTTDEDFVFYNAPVSQDGAVALSVDGDSEQAIRVDLDLLPTYCTRVMIAAAVSGDCTFGDIGAVTISVDGEDDTAATATLDAATSERTMLLAELYQRGEIWRVRVIGQGYDHGLAELATAQGVDVE
jgi:DNA polymerase-3 subunit epsilon